MKKILMILLICSFFTAISFAEDINYYVDRESKVQDQLKIGEVVQLGTDSVVEKNGVIYIVGNSTPREREDQLATYRQRMEKREKQVQEELDRALAIRLKEIEAQAMLDYLLAEALVYGNATRPQPTEFNIKGSRASAIANGGNVGNITSTGGQGGKGGNATGGSVGDLTLTARTGSVTANGGVAISNSSAKVGDITNTNDVNNVVDIRNNLTNNNSNTNNNTNNNTNSNTNNNSNDNTNTNTATGGSGGNGGNGGGNDNNHDNNGWGNGGDTPDEGDTEQTNPGNNDTPPGNSGNTGDTGTTGNGNGNGNNK